MQKTITAALALLTATLIACGFSSTDPGPTNGGKDPIGAATGQKPADDKPPAYVPQPADFALQVVVLSKQCFGSAGCNVTFKIEPTYNGPTTEGSYKIVYEVMGVEDAPQINHFTIDFKDGSYSGIVDSEEYAGTRSSKAELTAKATQVLPAR